MAGDFVPSYNGHEPYVFVSYSHEDHAEVMGEVRRLTQAGFNVWYDEGIRTGSQWADEIASRLIDASCVLFFVTPRSVQSKHCRDEIHLAATKQVRLVVVHLQQAELSPGLQLAIGLQQAISKVALPESRYRHKLISALHGNDEAEEPVLPVMGNQSQEGQSIGVLPFANLSSDPEQIYFCEGIADEVLNRLSKVRSLRVVARASSFRFRDKEVDVREIGQALQVSHILDGSVRIAGDRVRVFAQLVEVKTGLQTWSDRFDRMLSDVFEIQDEIGEAIVTELLPKLSRAQVTSSRSSRSMQTHELFLKGLHMQRRGTVEGLNQALELFNSVLDLEPEHGDAWSQVATTYLLLCTSSQADRGLKECLPRIEEAISQALEHNPDSCWTHRAKGSLHMVRKEWQQAEESFLYAITLSPQNPQLYAVYAYFLANSGRLSASARYIDYALTLDPLNPEILTSAAQIYHYLKKQNLAIDLAERALAIDPDYRTAYVWLAGVYGTLGDHQARIECMKRWNLVDLKMNEVDAARMNEAFDRGGIAGYVNEFTDWLIGKRSRGARSPHIHWFIAVYAGVLRRFDEAFDALERASEETVFLSDVSFFDPIRHEPRWKKILDKINLNDDVVEQLNQQAETYKAKIGFEEPWQAKAA